MATVKVRVSMWPDRDIEVDEGEVPWLRTQGILLEPDQSEQATPEPTDGAGTAEAPKSRRSKEA